MQYKICITTKTYRANVDETGWGEDSFGDSFSGFCFAHTSQLSV